MKKGCIGSVVTLLSVFFFSGISEARHFKVYGYKTPDQGDVELVYWVDFIADSDNQMPYFGKTIDREDLWAHTIEIEYGVTDRWTIAGYADFEDPTGEDFEYIQARAVVSRYRLWEKGERFFDTAFYIEYYLPDPDYQDDGTTGRVPKEKLETRIILEKEMGSFTLTLNPKLEKVLSGGDNVEGLEFEYGASLYYTLSEIFRPGLEFYGEMGELVSFKTGDQQEHYIVPAVKGNIGDAFKWNIGAAFGLTTASDDLVIKGIFEFEL